MIVGIHQPQYLPWLPYLLKIAECDLFILLDSVDFQKNGLQNRNQIKTAQGPLWLTVPVLQRLGQKILDVQINNRVDWRKKHWLAIIQNYGKAEAFKRCADELESIYQREWGKLVELNIALTNLMLKWLGLDRKIVRSSEMRARGKGTELVLNLCLEAGAAKYISGTGAHDYLDPEAFQAAGIEVEFRSPVLPNPYPQLHQSFGFRGDLSALDIILNCGDKWRSYLPASQAEST